MSIISWILILARLETSFIFTDRLLLVIIVWNTLMSCLNLSKSIFAIFWKFIVDFYRNRLGAIMETFSDDGLIYQRIWVLFLQFQLFCIYSAWFFLLKF